MKASELIKGQQFTYGRKKKPISLKNVLRVSDYSGPYASNYKLLIVPDHGKQFFMDPDETVFLFEPYQVVEDLKELKHNATFFTT